MRRIIALAFGFMIFSISIMTGSVVMLLVGGGIGLVLIFYGMKNATRTGGAYYNDDDNDYDDDYDDGGCDD